MSTISIYVQSLDHYNRGYLDGKWLNLPMDEEDLHAALDFISNDEEDELFIPDYETEVDGLKVDEYENIITLNEQAEELAELEDYELSCVEAMLQNGSDLEEALNGYSNCILWSGCEDMAEVAEQYCEGCGILSSIPSDLRKYFDFESYGEDMEQEGSFVETSEGIVEILP